MNKLFPDPNALASVCRKHDITRLSLFGSVLEGRARADSDVDLLVEFMAGSTPGFLGMAAIEEDLSALLGGRTVDLRTPEELSRYFRDQVIRGAVDQYAA